MKYVKEKVIAAVEAIRSKPTEEAAEIVANLFLELEMEMDYIDRRRVEAEENFANWVDTVEKMKEEKENKLEPDENYVSTGE